jgi:hypothetical protein
MYRWQGNIRSVSLPEEIEEDLRTRSANILDRHGLGDRLDIVQELVDEVSWAFAGSEHELKRTGRGRPVDGTEKLVAVLVPDMLSKHGIRGNWLQGDAGEIGIVAELEAVAQASLRHSRKEDRETTSRPARTTEARKLLGKVHRNDPLPKFDPELAATQAAIISALVKIN